MNILDEVRNQSIGIDEFLASQDESTIQKRMFERLPSDLDVSEGSYVWDALVPTSFEHALAYMTLRYALHMAFPQRSAGEHLTLHAEAHGTPRRAAKTASGFLEISGSPGMIVPTGTRFCSTVSEGSTESPKYYYTTEEFMIPESGIVVVPIKSAVPGEEGNIKQGEINVNIEKLSGIFSVVNTEPLENGIAEEDDSVLLPRMLERVQNPPSSGNKADYRRWAKEVPGVGDAIIRPLWNGPGSVKIAVIGVDGEPVSEEVIKAVQKYIDPGESGEGDGKAPIGAKVTISSVAGLPINIVIPSIEYENNFNSDTIQPVLKQRLRNYLSDIPPGGIIRLKEVEAIITDTPGIADFQTITINGTSANLPLAEEEKATLGEVILA